MKPEDKKLVAEALLEAAKQLEASSTVKMYHVTEQEAANSIEQEGFAGEYEDEEYEDEDDNIVPPRFMYHTSSPTVRSAIERHGLKPGKEASYGPPAVYLWAEQWVAESYYWADDQELLDVWKVDTDGLTIEPDPEDPGTAWYTTSNVGPSRVTFVGTFRNGELIPQEQLHNLLKDGHATRPIRPVSASSDRHQKAQEQKHWLLNKGCIAWAKAYKDIFGGKLFDVVEPEPNNTWALYPGRPHHVVVKTKDGVFHDATGPYANEQELLSFWEERRAGAGDSGEKLVLEPHNGKRAKDQGLVARDRDYSLAYSTLFSRKP